MFSKLCLGGNSTLSWVVLVTPSQLTLSPSTQLEVDWQEYSLLSVSWSSLPSGHFSMLNFRLDLTDSAVLVERSAGSVSLEME